MPQQDDYLICRNSDYGPTFGDGYDILIYDGCDSMSYTDFPLTYNRAGENKLENNEDTYRMFLGEDTKNFKVEEYEVFKLWYL